ncbi:MAG: methyltransferase domain-containing protein [Steroidobacteraceae bacterium]
MLDLQLPPALELPPVPAGLAPIAGLLQCPACRGALRGASGALQCAGCQRRFEIRDDVPLLAIHGSSETWGVPQQLSRGTEYQSEFQDFETAAAYNRKHRWQLPKLLGTRREFQLLRRHFGRLGRSRSVLELPCGGGRLTPAFAGFSDLVIEADIGIGQILYGRSAASIATPRIWMTASAFHIPLRDDSVDGTVCVRLSHHLPTPEERTRLFRELLRVSRRFVIVTYFDYQSPINIVKRLRGPFSRKPAKVTMTTAEVAGLARAHGARLVAAPMLAWFGSGHRYALIVKDAPMAASPASGAGPQSPRHTRPR